MTRFWVESLKPSTSIEAEQWPHHNHGTTAEPRTHNLPVPSECATCYATDAGSLFNTRSLTPRIRKQLAVEPFFDCL